MYCLSIKPHKWYFSSEHLAQKDACYALSVMINRFNLDKCAPLEIQCYFSILSCIADAEYESAINMWNCLSPTATLDNYITITEVISSYARDIDQSDVDQCLVRLKEKLVENNLNIPQVTVTPKLGATCGTCGYFSEYAKQDASYLCPQCKLMKGVFC